MMSKTFRRGACVALAVVCLAEAAFDARAGASADAGGAQEPQASPAPAATPAPDQPEGRPAESAPPPAPQGRTPAPSSRDASPVDSAAPPAAAPVDGEPASESGGDDAPRSRSRPSVRVGSDYVLGAGETTREAVVVCGSSRIAGHVEGDAVVVLGEGHLSSTAVVEGDLVVVGGRLTIEPGATVGRDLVVVAGSLSAPEGFMPGGEQVVIGPLVLGDGVRALLPWITHGLFWGRPIVPSLPWVWGVAAAFLVLYLLLNLVFAAPVKACAEHVTARPLSTALVGALVLVLLGPVAVLLAVSVVGLVVIPFLICAVVAAGLLGKVGVLRALGGTLVPPDDADHAPAAARSVLIGAAIMTAVYVVPVIGLVAWALLGALGLGAGAMAVAAALRRENPRPAPPPIPTPAVPPPVQSATFDAAGASAASEPAAAFVPPIPVPAPAPDLSLAPRATFLKRLGAFVLDLLLVAIALSLLRIDHDGPGRLFLLLLVYRIGFWAWKGTTIGGIITHLRVVRTDGAPLGFGDALVRGLASIFSFAVLGLGCLVVASDPGRQAWHDKIAGTCVVQVPPGTAW